MVARLLSLLALFALLLMPLVPAQAMPVAAPMTMTMNGDGHCGDGQALPDKTLPGTHCGSACALLLPEPGRCLSSFPVGSATPDATRVAALESFTVPLGTPPPRSA